MQFFEECLELKLCGLLSFRRKINNVDLSRMLAVDAADLEVIYLPHCDRFFAFSVLDILALKELLDGAMAILRLNSLIHRETVRKPAYL